jgi:hypothetical protein
VVTDHVVEAQQLVHPYGVSMHHACRVKMYHKGGRDFTEDLADHIAFVDGGFHVECLDETTRGRPLRGVCLVAGARR